MADKASATAAVIENDAAHRTMLTGMLEKEGIDALGFDSAEAALSAMDRDRPPKVIVTNLYMPGMDGWRFCNLLRSPEYAPFNRIPVIAVSAAFTGEEAPRIIKELNADAFHPSPVDGRIFITQVRALLRRERRKEPNRVLIVDDSRAVAGLIQSAFEDHGYRVDLALSVRQGTTACGRDVYDVAVIDYHLPDGAGDTLLQTIKKDQPDCVCVMITNDSRPQLADEWLKKGAAAYVRKPFSPDYLIEICARARREKSLLRSERLLEQRSRRLWESEGWMREVFRTSMDAILIFNPDGVIVSSNPAACQMYGYDEGEMEGLTGRDIVHPDCWHLFERFKRLPENGGRFRTESVDVRQDGTPFDVEVSGSVFQYFGRPHLLAMARNITDRKRAEAALKESEARYRSLTENFPNGALFLLDAEFRYLAADGKGFAAAGLSSEDVVGKTVVEVFPELWEGIRPHLEAVFRGEEACYDVEYGGRTYSNQCLPVVDDDGRIRQGIVVTQDVTDALRTAAEKERLEDRFHHAQKLESIGRLAGGVAHDLNNLLTPILGYGEMILDEFGPEDGRRAPLATMMEAGHRAKDLVRQLLAFSRKQVLEIKPVDLNGVLTRFGKLLRRTIREDVAIDMRLAPSLPLVKGDVGQLEQVIMNLSVNAQDAMEGGGVLTFETRPDAIAEADAAAHEGVAPGPCAALSVGDTGCGMDDRIRRHIFEPFFTTKDKDKGTGLGLATVYGIVRQHGGVIRVESAQGKGTVFTICLPVFEGAPPAREAAPDAPRSGSGRGETILLAEDNKGVREMTRALLEREGYSVLAAESGKAALEILNRRGEPVHLLLIDVVLPDMSGRDLLAHIPDRAPRPKVLYMSGYNDEVIAHRGVLDEGVHFIQKPFSVRALATRIREVIQTG